MNDDPRVNLLKDHFDLNPNPRPSPWMMGKYFFVTVLVGIVVGISFSFVMTRADIQSEPGEGGFLKTVASFVSSGDRRLVGETSDRINVLFFGIGGKGHDGPELTDTIIYGSMEPSTGKVGLMSIPRDLTIPVPGYNWRKINHANYFGEVEDPGNGAKFASGLVGDVIGQDINYYVKVDFKGFEEFIDALGGVNVYVDRSFSDSQYPTDDYLTQTIAFQEGWQKMDGETALQFARSRHGTNGEGSDFARSKRQQKIILAVKERMFSASTLLNPTRIPELISTVSGNVETNLSTWEILRLARLAGDIKTEDIKHVVLDTSPSSPLYQTTINGSYVILPENDDWTGVRQIAANLLSEDTDSSPLAYNSPPPSSVRLSIENGTAINGFAFRTSQLLEGQGFEVTNIANAATRDWDHTVIYDLSNGAYPSELEALQEYLKADVSTTVTGWLFSNNVTPRSITLDDEGLRDGRASEHVDFLVILGQNSANLVRQ